MPTHEIPHILFGVQNRVSYKSRQLKNSTLSTTHNSWWTSYLRANLIGNGNEKADWEISS